jgi:hypothetical protein
MESKINKELAIIKSTYALPICKKKKLKNPSHYNVPLNSTPSSMEKVAEEKIN